MGDDKKSFVLYTSNAKQFAMLSDEQAGKLIKGIFSYADNNGIPEFNDGMIQIAFSFIQEQIDANNEKWEETRKKRSEAGKKGGRPSKNDAETKETNDLFSSDEKPKKANGFFAFDEKPKKAVNVNVNDNVNVNVNDNVNVNEKSFELFWKAYPKKVNKASAMKTWNKLEPDDDLVRLILSALEQFKQTEQWQKEDGQYIPYPSTWLNNKRWEDNLFCDTTSQKEYSFDLNDYKSLVNNFGEE